MLTRMKRDCFALESGLSSVGFREGKEEVVAKAKTSATEQIALNRAFGRFPSPVKKLRNGLKQLATV